jgi:hypothetical protein
MSQKYVCHICKNEKNLDELVTDRRQKLGKKKRCLECNREAGKKWASSEHGRKRHAETERNRRRRDPRVTMYSGAKQRAKKRGLEFSLSIEDIVIPVHCPVLGIKIEQGDRQLHLNAPTLDRIDPSKGYTKENVLVVSWRANRLKSDATLDEMEKLYQFYKEVMSEHLRSGQ